MLPPAALVAVPKVLGEAVAGAETVVPMRGTAPPFALGAATTCGVTSSESQAQPLPDEAAHLISRGYARGQIPDNIVIFNTKREERDAELADEAAEDAESAAEAPASYLPDPCPSCGSFTLYLDEADGDTACDTCGHIGKVEANE